MENLLDAWMGRVWVGDSSWLTLAALRALVVCFTALVVVKGLRRVSGRASYLLYMSGSLVILVAFSLNVAYSIINDTHPMLTWNALFVDLGIILCMVGALYSDTRLREAQGLETKNSLRGLTNTQRRASLILGILLCVFTVSIEGIQVVFGILGVALMLVYLLPPVDERR